MAEKKKSSSDEVLVVGSKVKAAIKATGCNTSGDAIDGLNAWVGWLISQAAARAKANGRKTVRAHDFMVE
jgi:histone H3/H4